MNVPFQRGRKAPLHCLGWMDCWEEDCTQARSWGRTWGWWWRVERGWNSARSGPAGEMTGLELGSPFFLASGEERPEYLREGQTTTTVLIESIYRHGYVCEWLNERSKKIKVYKQKKPSLTCVPQPQEEVLLRGHSNGGWSHSVFEIFPEVKKSIEAKERG